MSPERPAWVEAVSENREALERIAEHGQTELADDVRRMLEEADTMESGQ